MVLGRLARHAHSPRLRLANGPDAPRGADVGDVEVRAGQLGEEQVALHHGHLGDRRHAGEAEASRHRSLVHAAAVRQREVLGMHHDGQVEVPGIFERSAHHSGRHDRPAVVGDADATRFLQLGHVGKLLAERAAGDRSGGQDAGQPRLPGTRLDEPRDGSAVANGPRVRHGDERGDAARDGGLGPCRDGLLPFLARLAEVDVEVHEAGQDEQAAAIDHLVRLALRRARRLLAHLADASAVEDHGPRSVDAGSGIDHAAAFEEDHAATRARRQRASAAMRTATPLST